MVKISCMYCGKEFHTYKEELNHQCYNKMYEAEFGYSVPCKEGSSSYDDYSEVEMGEDY